MPLFAFWSHCNTCLHACFEKGLVICSLATRRHLNKGIHTWLYAYQMLDCTSVRSSKWQHNSLLFISKLPPLKLIAINPPVPSLFVPGFRIAFHSSTITGPVSSCPNRRPWVYMAILLKYMPCKRWNWCHCVVASEIWMNDWERQPSLVKSACWGKNAVDLPEFCKDLTFGCKCQFCINAKHQKHNYLQSEGKPALLCSILFLVKRN